MTPATVGDGGRRRTSARSRPSASRSWRSHSSWSTSSSMCFSKYAATVVATGSPAIGSACPSGLHQRHARPHDPVHRLEVLGIELSDPVDGRRTCGPPPTARKPQTDLRPEKLALRCRDSSGRAQTRPRGRQLRVVLVVQLRLSSSRVSRARKASSAADIVFSALASSSGMPSSVALPSSPLANALLSDGSAIAFTNFMSAWTASLSALNVGSPSKIGSGSLKPSASWRNDLPSFTGVVKDVRARPGAAPHHLPPSVRRMVAPRRSSQRGTAPPTGHSRT